MGCHGAKGAFIYHVVRFSEILTPPIFCQRNVDFGLNINCDYNPLISQYLNRNSKPLYGPTQYVLKVSNALAVQKALGWFMVTGYGQWLAS